MGKEFVADAIVGKYFTNLQTSTPYIIGLLIGQREFVGLAVQIPLKDPGKNTDGLIVDHDKADIVEHAEHVNHMLTGGLSVTGLFLISPSSQSKESHNKMRRIMIAVETRLSEGRLWTLSEEDISDRLLLHVCSNTKKVTCWSMDIEQPSKPSKSACLKYHPLLTAFWPIVICPMEIDLMLPMKDKTAQSLNQCMKDGLQKWADKIQGSVCLLNKTKLPDDTNLNPPTKRRMSQLTRVRIQAEVLIPTTGQLKEKPSTASLQACSCILRLKGHLQCRAVMNTDRVTAKTVITYIKRDIMRSVYSSAKNFFEHLMIDENLVNALMGSQPLAQRVFVQVPRTGLSVCDYILPSETEAAVQERISKWMGFTMPEGKLHVTQELVQGRLQWHQDSEEGIDSTWLPVIKLQQKRRITMGVAVASGVALVACLIYMLFLSE